MSVRALKKALFLLGLIVVVAFVSVAIVIEFRSAKRVATRASSRRHLMQIAIALENYHEHHGCFPPAYVMDEHHTRMHSWRVLLLPYLDQESLYSRYKFDEPWNSPANRSLAKLIPMVYRCPADSEAHVDAEETTANYVVVVGEDTMWPGHESMNRVSAGCSSLDRVFVLEIRDSDIQWTEPRDLTPEQVLALVQRRKDAGNTSGLNYITYGGDTPTLGWDIDPQF